MIQMCFNKGTLYEQKLNIGKVTQLLGMNCIDKERIFRHIELYFTTKKSIDIELFYNDEVPDITINKEKVSKTRFEVFHIRNMLDIDFHLSNKKDTTFHRFANIRFNNHDINKHMETINNELTEVVKKANINLETYFGEDNQELPQEFIHKNITIGDILKNNLLIEKNIELSNFEKICLFIKLVVSNYSNNLKEHIIIFNNIDCFLSVCEYKKVFELMESISLKSSIYFFVATSKVGYNMISEENINYATVFNKKVFDFPNIEYVTKFLYENYPIDKNFTDDEVVSILNEICHFINSDIDFISIKSLVCCKILNDYEHVKNKGVGLCSDIELKYLQ